MKNCPPNEHEELTDNPTTHRSIQFSEVRMHPVDWAAIAVLLFEIPSIYFSIDRANSILVSETITLAVLAYFLVRWTITSGARAAWLSVLVGIGGAALALHGILQFATRTRVLASVGFTDFLAFRSHLMNPIRGWIAGEAFTAVLLSLFFSYAAVVYVWKIGSRKDMFLRVFLVSLPACMILAAISLSLSRSVLASTLLFLIIAPVLMVIYRVMTFRKESLVLVVNIATLFVALGFAMILYPGILRAYAGTQVSQIRSVRGRVGIWDRSLKVIAAHPVWGVGSSNAAMSLLPSADQSETLGFASRTFSLPIQVMTEKGLAGFAIYFAFIALSFLDFHRGMQLGRERSAEKTSAHINKRTGATKIKRPQRNRLQSENAYRAMKCCFAAGVLSILIREVTYSSLLEHSLTLILAFALIACMCSTPERSSKIKPIVIAIAILVGAFQCMYIRYRLADAKLQQFYSQVMSTRFSDARNSIDKAIRLWPWNGRYYAWRGYLISQTLPSQCLRMSPQSGSGLNADETRLAEEAAVDYRHSLRLNGLDAVAYHNLAWLEHLLAHDKVAAVDLQKSIEIDPDNAVFHLSYGMFLEEEKTSQAAQRQYESAIELKPSIASSPFFVRYRHRSPVAANLVLNGSIKTLECELRQTGDPIIEAKLGELYLYAGNTERSADLLKSAALHLPNLPIVWFNLGELSKNRGDSEQALSDYEKARTIDEAFPGTYLRIGEIKLRRGHKENAFHDLRVAEERWERINPITAAHNNRLYTGSRQTIDDLLPTTLEWFISPCESSEAMRTLSQMVPQNREYADRSTTCEKIPSPHSELE